MADALPPPEVSPTGKPVVPQWLTKLGLTLLGLGSTAMAALQFIPAETPWKANAMAGAVVATGLGGLLSGAGPGVRKAGTDAAAKVQTTQDVLEVLNKPAP